MKKYLLSIFSLILTPVLTFAGEADLKIPDLSESQNELLTYGFIIYFMELQYLCRDN